MKKQIGIYKIIEQGDWEKFYKIINEINAGETFWDDIDKDELAELTFICWYLYVEHGVGIYKELNEEFIWNEIGKTLEDAYNCYLERFQADNDLMCLIGVMISTVDYPFPVPKGDLGEFSAMGNKMREDAYANEPNNPLIKCLNTKTAEREPYSEQAKEYLHRIFKDCDGLIEYFDHSLGYKPK